MKIIGYPVYLASLSASLSMSAFASDNPELISFFNTNISPQMHLCGVCHIPNGLADVEDGDKFLLHPGKSQYENFFDAWVMLGKGVSNNRLLTMNSDPTLNHTGLQNWPTTSSNYKNVSNLLTCWHTPSSCTIIEQPTEGADLSVSMAGNNGKNNNGVIRYSITVRNSGPSTANSLEITHQLPAPVTLSSVTPNSIAYTLDGRKVMLYLDSLASGTSRNINIIVNTATTNTNRMSFTSSINALTEDPNPGNNTSTAQFGGGVVIADRADLSVSMTGQNGENQNGVISYSINVKNAGPAAARSLEIVHNTPPQVTLGSVSPSSIAYTSEGGEITFYLESLASGANRNINIKVNTETNNRNKMDFTTDVSSETTDPNVSNNSSEERFGGSIDWLFLIFSGILMSFRSLRKTIFKHY